MNSKEALESICKTCDNKSCPYIHYEKSRCIYYGIVREYLDRLEKLEKENQELKELFKKHFVYSKKTHTIRKSIKNFDYETIKGVLEND